MPTKVRKKWKARVKHNYKERFLGYFESKEDAIQAEQEARIKLKGTPNPVRKRVAP